MIYYTLTDIHIIIYMYNILEQSKQCAIIRILILVTEDN